MTAKPLSASVRLLIRCQEGLAPDDFAAHRALSAMLRRHCDHADNPDHAEFCRWCGADLVGLQIAAAYGSRQALNSGTNPATIL